MDCSSTFVLMLLSLYSSGDRHRAIITCDKHRPSQTKSNYPPPSSTMNLGDYNLKKIIDKLEFIQL